MLESLLDITNILKSNIEAVARRCSIKKVFIKSSQNPEEATESETFFNEAADCKYFQVSVITEALQNSKKESINELHEKMELNKLTLSCYFVFLVHSELSKLTTLDNH